MLRRPCWCWRRRSVLVLQLLMFVLLLLVLVLSTLHACYLAATCRATLVWECRMGHLHPPFFLLSLVPIVPPLQTRNYMCSWWIFLASGVPNVTVFVSVQYCVCTLPRTHVRYFQPGFSSKASSYRCMAAAAFVGGGGTLGCVFSSGSLASGPPFVT